MKTKLLLTIIISVFIFACKKSDENTKEKFKIDPNAKVYVKPNITKSLALNKSKEHLSYLEVVKQARVLNYYNDLIAESYCNAMWVGKDTVSETPALLRWGTDIIYDTDGYGHYGLQTEFIYGYDMVICKGIHPHYDTIAYIPNVNITNAREAIIEALEAKDTIAVYDIFKNAFKFIPITGSEWKLLKKQGLN